MKISIITVVYNAEQYIKDCIESVIHQSYQNIEYIIIDGNSTDGTIQVIEEYRKYLSRFVSEKDKGLYDAINKGIKLASGDVIGILNADDMLLSYDVVSEIANAFINHPEKQAIYGNLNYITPKEGKIVREWRSYQADQRDIEKGWMPAHPTLYIKRTLFEAFGNYALDMGTAADYDLMLRYFHIHKMKALYLPVLMVNMRLGGLSNRSISSLWKAAKFDYKALKRNKIPNALLVLVRKKLSKLSQF
ncbi:glycosyltransferase family 2 protein [Pedobacter agri]|uniref:Glycosyltransferase family 2 protein n=1 Tax=Pedobacter agri TaxID=454586 RepID=A0A9X3I7C3_9SPHI|nr:glycosyltransferase family 2 protein [Pedobacter agri]MCX3263622.1 glycosyltransferase family 2 protein [Pedobacter agri]